MREQEQISRGAADSVQPVLKGKVIILNGMSPQTAESLYYITLQANENHTTWRASSFQMELADPHNLYLGYEEEGTLLGYIGCMLVLEEASINNYGVLPEHRRKGIGATLMEHLLSHCRKRDVEKVFLEVRISNQAAISLYKKFGFEKIGYRKDYYLDPVEDAYLCLLSINKTDTQR